MNLPNTTTASQMNPCRQVSDGPQVNGGGVKCCVKVLAFDAGLMKLVAVRLFEEIMNTLVANRISRFEHALAMLTADDFRRFLVSNLRQQVGDTLVPASFSKHLSSLTN